MTSTATCVDYEAAKRASSALRSNSDYAPGVWRYLWTIPLVHLRIGSSSCIYDPRASERIRGIWPDLTHSAVRPVAEQVQELLASLSLNKSQLARILHVTRPTIYEWLQGNRPNYTNAKRLNALLGVLDRASVSSSNPLNARFVRHPLELGLPPLVELLGAEQVDVNRLVQVMKQAKRFGDMASERRTSREDRLRRLGFEEPDRMQRKEQLARNVALMDWPK